MEGRERIKEILLKQMEMLQEESARLRDEGLTSINTGVFHHIAESICKLSQAYNEIDWEV